MIVAKLGVEHAEVARRVAGGIECGTGSEHSFCYLDPHIVTAAGTVAEDLNCDLVEMFGNSKGQATSKRKREIPLLFI